MKQTSIIFDLGGVLIDWNPSYLFEKVIPDEERRKYFLEQVCTPEWNEEQDGGRSIREANELLIAQFPEWKKEIETYYERWTEMLSGPIDGTVQLFKELKEKNQYKFYALTNWSAELFPIALEKFHFLHWFDGRVVSGEEKMRKPFPAFYKLLLDRYNLDAKNAVFIDDNKRNIQAAVEAGIPSIQFTSPEALREELVKRGLL
ncbi:MAG: HAD family phosphatase [Flavisolibacter sp.]|jgi:2-haloacid dehalogenase|nr:HAD family phosphatase [Flavisolibacter sp.]